MVLRKKVEKKPEWNVRPPPFMENSQKVAKYVLWQCKIWTNIMSVEAMMTVCTVFQTRSQKEKKQMRKKCGNKWSVRNDKQL